MLKKWDRHLAMAVSLRRSVNAARSQSHFSTACYALAIGLLLAIVSGVSAETVARCGQGWLERIDGYRVLHLKGTPYEIGYQHGALLKQDVRANLDYLVNVKGATPVKIGPLPLWPRAAIAAIVNLQWRHVPSKYFDEMAALATAAERAPSLRRLRHRSAHRRGARAARRRARVLAGV